MKGLDKIEVLTLLMDRVKYINNIRMGNFKFYILAVGVLLGFFIQKIDVYDFSLYSTELLSIIQVAIFIVFLIGFSMFIFDIWALARLRATTNGIKILTTNQINNNDKIVKPWNGFDEDFWLVIPMMLINSALLAMFLLSISAVIISDSLTFIISSILFLSIQIFLQRCIPPRLAKFMGELPDSYKKQTI